MTLSFSSAPGNLFNALGKAALLVKQCKSYQTSQKTNLIDNTNGLIAQLIANPDIQALVGSQWVSILGGPESACSLAQSVAYAILNRLVFNDNPQLNQTFQSSNNLTSLQEVIRQMKLSGASVLAMTITAVPQTTSNPGPHFRGSGNGVINTSVKRPLDGLVLENSFGETIKVLCTADSYTGGTLLNNETFTLTGVGSETDLFAYDWPQGSNQSVTLNAIDGTSDNASGNLLTNSDFGTFANTPNVPDNFTLTVGVAGTNIFQESSLVYGAAAAVRILGDAPGTLVSFQQQFNSASGTSGTLSPLTQYAHCIFLRRDGINPANGTLQVDLVDQNNVIINDANGSPNSYTIDLTALSTTYAPFTGMFRTPAVLPAQQSIRYHLVGTPLTVNRSVYLDLASLGLSSQLGGQGTGSPFFAIHAGSIPFQLNDLGTVLVSNSRGAGGTLSTFQTALYQLFNNEIVGNELLVPSSSSPTISDGLIA